MVAFGYIPQNFGRWRLPMNRHFAEKLIQFEFCGQSMLGGDTQTLLTA